MKTMHKRDYYIHALNAGAYRYKTWVITLFSETSGEAPATEVYPYALSKHIEKNTHYFTFKDPSTHEEILLEGTFTTGAPFSFREEITIAANEVPNIHKGVTTFYGNLLVNYICLVYAFGDKVEFRSGPETVARMEREIQNRLTDKIDPSKPNKNLTIDEFKLFNDGVRHLEGFSSLCVPSASEKTMTVSPAVIKRRDELVKEYKGQLEDPIIQAKIDKELISMEKEWMKGDPAERFYINNKSYDVVRKKLFLMQGQESGFGKIGKTITSSLAEGWDINNLPAMANALRNGSYSRGFLTALGGVEAKGNYRIFQNTTVTEEDCGTKLGLRLYLSKDIARHFISSSVINENGTITELTEENIHEYYDKPVIVRSVAYCQTANQNVCAVCVGKKIAQTPTAISTYASDLGSTFVGIMLKVMHGVALKTAQVDYLADLT